MKHLVKHQAMFRVLEKATPKLRKSILSECNDDVIRILAEVIVNLMIGQVGLSSQQKEKLARYKKTFRNIVRQCKHNHINKKKVRKELIQSGGALPFLIPLLLPLIAKAALGGAVAASTGAITKKIIG